MPAHAGSYWYPRTNRIGTLVVALLSMGPVAAHAQEQAASAWPNTLRLQSLIAGSKGRDIVKMRQYDHIGSPSCTKDGEFAAFDAFKIVSKEMVSSPECLIVRQDGTGLFRLTHGSTPRWSPDGKRLLFMAKVREIWIKTWESSWSIATGNANRRNRTGPVAGLVTRRSMDRVLEGW